MPPTSAYPRLHKSVFPPGFDILSSGSKASLDHYTHPISQLLVALIDGYNPWTPSEIIIVKSAWYGKQTNSAEHEFIVIQVEDTNDGETYDGELINYMILDRNVLDKPASPSKPFTHSRIASRGATPVDTFRVSYDGNVEALLKDCGLHPHRFLERLDFPSEHPLRLYELVTLASVVSKLHSHYEAVDSNCYVFAGIVWDSLHHLHPDATHTKPLAKQKGRYGWFRYTLDKSQVQDACEAASVEIVAAKGKIESRKAQFESLIREHVAVAMKETQHLRDSETGEKAGDLCV